MPWDDGTDDTKGWDRASIAYKSRKPYFPSIEAKDLRLPAEAGRFRTLVMCAACAVCLTLLYLGVPLFAVTLVFYDLGAWLPGILIATTLLVTVLLFAVSIYETRELRRLAREF
jgi:hypothetical protein